MDNRKCFHKQCFDVNIKKKKEICFPFSQNFIILCNFEHQRKISNIFHLNIFIFIFSILKILLFQILCL